MTRQLKTGEKSMKLRNCQRLMKLKFDPQKFNWNHFNINQSSFKSSFYYFLLQNMKNSTIQLLYQGKRRPVEKQEYSKLRNYNKIKTSRVREPDSSNLEETFRSYEQYQSTAQKLTEVIECLKKDNEGLTKENEEMVKEIKKYSKVDKLIEKKLTHLYNNVFVSEGSLDFGSLFCEKDFQSMLQLKLSLDVIELQSYLSQKTEDFKGFQSHRKKHYEQEVVDNYFKQKTLFLTKICPYSQGIWEKLALQKDKVDELKKNMDTKLRKNEKLKLREEKNLQTLQFQQRQLQLTEQERKKRLRKDSCEFIQIENGEIRNQQDIKKQLKQMQSKTKAQGQQLQSYLEQKMLEKIALINQIEKYEQFCRKLPLEKSQTKSGESIKVI